MCDSQPLEFLTSHTNETSLSVPFQWPCHSAITPDAERRSDPGAGRAARGCSDAAWWKARLGQSRDRELGQPRGHPPAGPEVAHEAGGLNGLPPSEGGGCCSCCWSGWDICVSSQDTSLLTDARYQKGLCSHTRGISAIQGEPFQCYSVLCWQLWLTFLTQSGLTWLYCCLCPFYFTWKRNFTHMWWKTKIFTEVASLMAWTLVFRRILVQFLEFLSCKLSPPKKLSNVSHCIVLYFFSLMAKLTLILISRFYS